jgi:TolB-like protein
MRGARRLGVALLLLALAVSARAEEPTATLALLPFENVSGSVQGVKLIMPVLEQALKARGYRLADAERLEALLFRERIRSTGLLSAAALHTLRRELGAELAMVGAVGLFNDSPTNPQWGLAARVVDTESARIAWAGAAGLTGDDFTVALGLGTITSSERLGREVVTRLLRDVPEAGQPFAAPRPTRALHLPLIGLKASYRSPALDTDPPRRVAVLPFENLSERRGAGRILTDVFTTALFRQGRFEVVDPGVVSESLAAIGAAPFGTIDLDTLAALGKRAEADAVILGSIFTYSEGLKKGPTTSPEVSLDARALDVASGRILWSAAHSRAGDDSAIVLHFGAIRSMIPLALKVAREMVETL